MDASSSATNDQPEEDASELIFPKGVVFGCSVFSLKVTVDRIAGLLILSSDNFT